YITVGKLDLDETYFYHPAVSQNPKNALLCKRQSNNEYMNDVCPSGNGTKSDESNFKFYMKILEKLDNLVMLFNKATQQSITIQSIEQHDQELPLLKLLLNNSARFTEVDEMFNINTMHPEDYICLLQTAEIFIGCIVHRPTVGHPVDGKPHREIAMQIDEMDDQQHKHLHRNGAPKKEQNIRLIDKSEGPKTQAPAC
uniref:Uncharacterized protein n=1 Tax=Romanomermis culicivorax TaxID=13658 RepID=A0A915IM38_ROMCU